VLATSVVGAAVIQVGHSLNAGLQARMDETLALQCAEKKLQELKPGGFSIQPATELTRRPARPSTSLARWGRPC